LDNVAACVSSFCALLSASLAGKPFVFDLHLQFRRSRTAPS
jgi:hypothetical protein